jgi:hypothetical protein
MSTTRSLQRNSCVEESLPQTEGRMQSRRFRTVSLLAVSCFWSVHS